VHGPSVYMFDERELQRWKLDESKLRPAHYSVRQPTLWEQHKWTLLTGSLIIVGLALLTVFLLFKQKQLNRARKAQEQLSGMLLNAQEQERMRLAAEIHDDFSQRLAVLSLGLETTDEGIPESMSQPIDTCGNSWNRPVSWGLISILFRISCIPRRSRGWA